MRLTRNCVDQIYDSIHEGNYEAFLKGVKHNKRKALSPFSDEKTPSFHYCFKGGVNFKDFSSGKGGTFIQFLMESQGMTYREALEWTANANGILIETEEDKRTPEEKEARQELKGCHLWSMERYAAQLLELPDEHKAWQEISGKRNLTREEAFVWGLGFAPGGDDQWTWLWDQLREKGWMTPGIDLGLLRESQSGKVYDAIRQSVTFPIRDHMGNVVGYGARNLQWEKGCGFAKYINSAENDIYDKSAILYGLDTAKTWIRERQNAYLVEGYWDVISMQRHQFEAVATCGTSLTPDQCRLLRRFTNKVTVVRDGDEAGQKAARRDMIMLLSTGFEVHMVVLPSKTDPDDFIRQHETESQPEKEMQETIAA